jgi:folate-binding protein YgfZ
MSQSSQSDLQAIRQQAAFSTLDGRAFLRVTGPDATRWLNGMVTNNIKDLAPGAGTYNFLLNAQGRIQGDCTIYREADIAEAAYLLVTDSNQFETIHQLLDRFIIMDEVELTPVNVELDSLLILGEHADEVMESLNLPVLGGLQMASAAGAAEAPILILAPHSLFLPRYEVYGATSDITALRDRLRNVLGLPEVAPATIEQYRLLEARPIFGQDIRDRDLPQETGQTQALHFSKGCYVGQEIVERIHSRGNVHRIFSVFELEPEDGANTLPKLPAPLECNGKPAGELTSAAIVPLPGGSKLCALGYLRREAQESTLPITYPGGYATPGGSLSRTPVTKS